MFPDISTLLKATSTAAIAAQPFVGRMDKDAADKACVDALRAVLGDAHCKLRVVIGEGEKDQAPALFNNEVLGRGEQAASDMAVDPLEGTTFCATGQANSFAVMAVAESDTLWSPGPAFYMDKLVVGPEASAALDPAMSPEERVEAIALATNKPVDQVRVYLLDRPRNQPTIDGILRAGGSVSLYGGGDVLGGLMALMADQPVDALMGIGGTPEGVLMAVAAKALGGQMWGRPAPQLDEEIANVKAAGLDTQAWLGLDDLASGSELQFCITGITSGLILQEPIFDGEAWLTDSLLIEGPAGALHRIQSTFPKL